MPRSRVAIEIEASSRAVFALLHDYDRRLAWDTLLREARLLDGATEAARGVRSRCVGTWRNAFQPLETEYVQFDPPRVAAVKLTNRPLLFDRFAATIRHEDLDPGRSRLTYIYSFRTRPRCLAAVLDPFVDRLLRNETAKRFRSLRTFMETEAVARRGR